MASSCSTKRESPETMTAKVCDCIKSAGIENPVTLGAVDISDKRLPDQSYFDVRVSICLEKYIKDINKFDDANFKLFQKSLTNSKCNWLSCHKITFTKNEKPQVRYSFEYEGTENHLQSSFESYSPY